MKPFPRKLGFRGDFKPKTVAIFYRFLWLGASASDLPNILWITGEDTGPELGCYGDAYARTPRLDTFA